MTGIDAMEVSSEKKVEQEALVVAKQAKLLVVTNAESMIMADNTKKAIDERLKAVDNFFDPMVEAAHKAHKALTTKRAEVKKPLEEAKSYLVIQVKNYQAEQRKKAAEEERRLAEIARKEEEERLIKEAEEAEKAGNHEEAEAIIEEPVVVTPPVVKPSIPKVDNRAYATRPKARILNKMDIIKAVAANPVLQDLLDVNMTVANQKARALGKELGTIVKGLEYYEE